jgi:hypothetical protein
MPHATHAALPTLNALNVLALLVSVAFVHALPRHVQGLVPALVEVNEQVGAKVPVPNVNAGSLQGLHGRNGHCRPRAGTGQVSMRASKDSSQAKQLTGHTWGAWQGGDGGRTWRGGRWSQERKAGGWKGPRLRQRGSRPRGSPVERTPSVSQFALNRT